MSFEIGNGQFYVAMWQVVGFRGNWLAGTLRDDKGWCLRYRFWHSRDELSDEVSEWVTVRPGPDQAGDSPEVTRERYIELGDKLAENLVSTGYGTVVERLDLETDVADEIITAMGEKGWLSETRVVNPLTGEEQGGGEA